MTDQASGNELDTSIRSLLSSFELSSYRESLLEQLFCSELMQGCWAAGLPPVELSHAFVDFQGYDLVASCGPTIRHIQLKARGPEGKVRHWDLHRSLLTKPSACCVLLLPQVADNSKRIELSYRFFGGSPGERMLFPDGARPAKQSRKVADADGVPVRNDRPNHVRVPLRYFQGPMRIEDVVRALFGSNNTALAEADD